MREMVLAQVYCTESLIQPNKLELINRLCLAMFAAPRSSRQYHLAYTISTALSGR